MVQHPQRCQGGGCPVQTAMQPPPPPLDRSKGLPCMSLVSSDQTAGLTGQVLLADVAFAARLVVTQAIGVTIVGSGVHCRCVVVVVVIVAHDNNNTPTMHSATNKTGCACYPPHHVNNDNSWHSCSHYHSLPAWQGRAKLLHCLKKSLYTEWGGP